MVGDAAKRLTAVFIARDEEDRLPAALDSAAFADEIVVVIDSATRDGTERVARDRGARTLLRPFSGYGPQKNLGIAAATGTWVLSLDADEIVTDELAREIQRKLEAPGSPDVFRVPIQLEFMGRRLRHGKGTLSQPIRLFRRGQIRFSDDPVHERLIVSGPVGVLKNVLIHRSYRDLGHYLEKLERYTQLAAEARVRQRRRTSPLFAPLRAAWEFFDRTVLHLGFLDGIPGVIYAGLSTVSTYLKYARAWELTEGRQKGLGEEKA